MLKRDKHLRKQLKLEKVEELQQQFQNLQAEKEKVDDELFELRIRANRG